MTFVPHPQEIYRHFKGNLYQIITLAEHSETGEPLVIYQALYGDYKIYARPLNLFAERLDPLKYPEAGQEFRFELQTGQRTGDLSRREEAPAGTGEAAGAGKAEIPEKAGKADVPGKMEKADVSEKAIKAEAPGQIGNTDASEKMEKADAPEKSGKTEEAAWLKREEQEKEQEEEQELDPLLIEFLDADTYEQRLKILTALHHRITHEMLTTMAVACDIEVSEGDLEERYDSLRRCLLTLERYECNRLR